jgi:hypothetical protein
VLAEFYKRKDILQDKLQTPNEHGFETVHAGGRIVVQELFGGSVYSIWNILRCLFIKFWRPSPDTTRLANTSRQIGGRMADPIRCIC